MSVRLTRKIEDVHEGVQAAMAGLLKGQEGNMYARGLSTEGWNGGYQQALRDVQAYIQGYHNCGSRYVELWKAPTKRRKRNAK
ncbi:hypothetical protein CPT_Marzo_263 [Stenotrophomonas phage Marzo]|nr:hypothetical protein CPT_Marzo_263 [Stenotrophomonas phage Marzo]